jgi:hypothetical protein
MKFEESRPEHHVHEVHRPQGHAHMDQKLHKGMRSPIVGSLPGGDSGSGTEPGENGMGAPGEAPMQGY